MVLMKNHLGKKFKKNLMGGGSHPPSFYFQGLKTACI